MSWQQAGFEQLGLPAQRALAADPSQGGWLLGMGRALEAQRLLEKARTANRNSLECGQFKPEVIRFWREHMGLSVS